MKNVYLIILSAIAAEEATDFAEFGANACIAKGPFNEMAVHILAALDQSDHETSSTFSEKIIGLQDIYQRQITKELLSSKRHSEAILGNMSEGILELTLEGEIIYANPAAVSLIGIPEEKLLASNFTELFSKTHHKRIEDLLAMIGDKPQAISEDSPVILNSKQVSINIIPVKEEKNRSIIVIMNDITEHKQAEDALRESKEKYRDIFENVSDFLYFHDLDGNLIETNLAWKREYGFSEDDLVNLNVKDLIPDRHKHQFEDYLKRIKENGKDEGLMVVMTKDGGERIVEYRNSLAYGSKGPVGIRGSGRDITERVRAKEALKHERDKLQDALAKVKTLSGMLPICSNCKKIRDDKGYWNQIESYIAKHTEVDFSHSICPECAKKLYPEFYKGD
jgi:PAS domain S-box-containing protein